MGSHQGSQGKRVLLDKQDGLPISLRLIMQDGLRDILRNILPQLLQDIKTVFERVKQEEIEAFADIAEKAARVVNLLSTYMIDDRL